MQLDLKRTNVLGVGVSAINMDTAVELLLDARAQGRSGYVCVTGVHGVIESQRDPELKRIHNRSFLTVPDGRPMVWVGREQGFAHMGRVYGPDLMLALCAATSGGSQALGTGHEALGTRNQELSANVSINPTTHQPTNPTTEKKCFTHFLYGSTPEVLEKLKANLESKFPGIRIVGTFSPPFRPLTDDEETELQRMVAACKPDFFWVGLSTPKQERFMYAHCAGMNAEDGGQRTEIGEQRSDADLRSPISDRCKFPLEAGIMLGVGAAFDIHAGLLKDAPEWVKNSGLQWFYRLCQEPRRLWRRYLDIVPTFLWLAALQRLGIRKYELDLDR